MVQFRDALKYTSILFLQSHPYFKRSIAIISTAFLIYFLLSPGLIIFLLNINFTLSPLTFGWVTVSPFLKFRLKEDISSRKGKLVGVPAAKMLLFIDNRGKSTNIGDPSYNGLYVTLIPL